MDRFLIVVDMQKDFIDGALGTPEARAIVPEVVRRVEAARCEGRTVWFTQDTHADSYLQTSEGRHLPVPHCVAGTDGWRLHDALAPLAGESIEKPTFGSVRLVERLTEVAEADGANLDIALCGVCTDICVVSNALLLRAHFPEATLRVYADACAGSTPERHRAALAVLAACHVEVMDA